MTSNSSYLYVLVKYRRGSTDARMKEKPRGCKCETHPGGSVMCDVRYINAPILIEVLEAI
jgi:hypothetical protein